MSSSVDPYTDWLQIPVTGRHPSNYELLGLPAGEVDHQRITDAFEQRYDTARKYQNGQHAELAQSLLSELSHAHAAVLTAAEKSHSVSANTSDPATEGTNGLSATYSQALAHWGILATVRLWWGRTERSRNAASYIIFLALVVTFLIAFVVFAILHSIDPPGYREWGFRFIPETQRSQVFVDAIQDGLPLRTIPSTIASQDAVELSVQAYVLGDREQRHSIAEFWTNIAASKDAHVVRQIVQSLPDEIDRDPPVSFYKTILLDQRFRTDGIDFPDSYEALDGRAEGVSTAFLAARSITISGDLELRQVLSAVEDSQLNVEERIGFGLAHAAAHIDWLLEQDSKRRFRDYWSDREASEEISAAKADWSERKRRGDLLVRQFREQHKTGIAENSSR